MNKSGRLIIKQKYQAFTIVELLVVIVIIGILAAITIVSYSGISNKAIVAGLQNDLDSNAKLLKMYNVEYGYYPNSINSSTYCPDNPTPDSRYCLKAMSGAKLSYTGGDQSFTLINTHTVSGLSYQITENGVFAVATSQANILNSQYLSAGNEHTCAIASDSNAYCWGANEYGQHGNNSTANRSFPVAVNKTGVLNNLNIKLITAGSEHTCVVASDNNAYCWGRNNYGQLGNNSTTNSSVPVAVNTTGALSGLTIKSISAEYVHTCVIASDDNAYCWGRNNYGQLGNNSTTNSSVPVAVNTTGALSGLTIKSIAAGSTHTCAIASDNNAYCWGGDGNGQLGNNSTTNSSVPVAVNTAGALSGLTIKSISTGYYHTCVIASDDNVYCWGWGSLGQLGNNSTTNSSVPVAVDKSGLLKNLIVKSISSVNFHNCVIASDNNAYCWGFNNNGQLGNNSTADSSIPVAVNRTGVLSSLTIKSISAGYGHACVIASDNNAYCWGLNSRGQLGNNSTNSSSIPVAVDRSGVLNGLTIKHD